MKYRPMRKDSLAKYLKSRPKADMSIPGNKKIRFRMISRALYQMIIKEVM